MRTMTAWRVERPGPIEERPLRMFSAPVPEPGPGEVLIRVRACAVCRTDLHLAEGDLPPHRRGVVPGHEVVGEVEQLGGRHRRPAGGRPGGRGVAAPHLRHLPVLPRAGRRTSARRSRYTGWDADGGYAEYCVAPAAYAYRLPRGYDDAARSRRCCAPGIIGFRALRRADLPPGGRLGLYGFGASAHLDRAGRASRRAPRCTC